MASKWLEKQKLLEEMEAQKAAEVEVLTEEAVATEDPQYPPSQFKSMGFKPGDYVVWEAESNLWDIARRMHVDAKLLMQFNEIENPDELEPGVPIYYPYHKADSRQIEVEVLPEPVEMHVSKPGGCRKWGFANMRDWPDAAPIGYFPENTNIDIVAIARVPLVDAKDPTAAYYLEKRALGNYAETGVLRFAIGFANGDVALGYAQDAPEPTPPAPVAEQAIIEQAAIEATPKPVPRVMDMVAAPVNEVKRQEFIAKIAETPERYPNYFKTTVQRLPKPIDCIAVLPEGVGTIDPETGKRFVYIRDWDGRRPMRRLFHYQDGIQIAETFTVNGVLYGRTAKSIAANNWFGLPMELLQSDADMHNINLDAMTRSEYDGGYTTWSERHIWIPVTKALTKHLPDYIRSLQHKNNKNKG